MTNAIRILAIGSHAQIPNSLTGSLGRESGFVIVDCVGANNSISQVDGDNLDVVLIDVDMVGLVCLGEINRIRSHFPKIPIVLLGVWVSERHIEQALAFGVSGYIARGDTANTIAAAIRKVVGGGRHFSDVFKVRKAFRQDGEEVSQFCPSTNQLNPREIEVLQNVACGLTRKQIAAAMSISAKTVENHSSNLMYKLGIHDPEELTRFATQEDIIHP